MSVDQFRETTVVERPGPRKVLGLNHGGDNKRGLGEGIWRAIGAAAPWPWAAVQVFRGCAEVRRGRDGRDAVRLEGAIDLLRSALAHKARVRNDILWIRALVCLAWALTSLAEIKGDDQALGGAVTCLREAAGLARRAAPRRSFRIQVDLAVALTRLAEQRSDTDLLLEAVDLYRSAIDHIEQSEQFADWGRMQSGLATTLVRLGERQGGADHFREGIDSYNLALLALKRDRTPVDWAVVTGSLATALVRLAEAENSSADLDCSAGLGSLERAIAEFRAALAAPGLAESPSDWANIQASLATALLRRSYYDQEIDHLEESVAAVRSALRVFEAKVPNHDLSALRAVLKEALHELVRRQHLGYASRRGR